MKNNIDIKAVLADHEKRISHLEFLLSKPKSVPSQGKEKLTLPDYIIELRQKGFFSQPRTAEETHAKLRETYHCEQDRVAMALLRLAKRKELRRASKVVEKKKYTAYAW